MRKGMLADVAGLIVAALVVVGSVGIIPAYADPVLGTCDVVPNPTAANHSRCSGDNLGVVTTGGLDLSYADLDHTTAGASSVSDSSAFVDANLTDANWAGFGLDGSNFQGAVLDGIDLFNGRERGVNFDGAHITGANLSSGIFAAEDGFGPATFTGADVSGTDFTGSTFDSGTGLTDFTGATLTGAIFDLTNLVPSNVTVTATSGSGANVSWPAPQSETGEQPGPCHDAAGPVSSGSVFTIGTTTVTCTVVDSATSTFGTGSFTVTVTGTAPAFTSADAATFTVGQPAGFPVAATGTPLPTVTLTSGPLPAGILATPQGGGLLLSGSPALGSGGVYQLTFTASDGVLPDATQDFILTVDEAPGFTSAAATSFVVGRPGSFAVTAEGYPTSSITETGPLPSGVTFAGGTLAGTPAAGTGGSYPVTFTASNGVAPDATQTFILTVDQAPAISSANNVTFTAGQPGTFSVTATGLPSPTVTETGALPQGVSFVDRVLSGTPAAGTGGTYPITVTASNGVSPDATQTFTLTVDQAPAFSSAADVTFSVGQAGSFPVTTTGFPAPTVTETGPLPSGVTFAGGALAGTPATGTGGTYPVTFTASNGVSPDATQAFTLTIDQAPAFSSAADVTFSVGQAGSFPVTTTGFPTATVTETGPLPSGVTFAGGALAGTPAAGTGGTYPVTFTASNGVSPDATQTFTLTIDQAPAFTSADATTFAVGKGDAFTTAASGFPAAGISLTSGKLPKGVAFAKGVLSGTPAAGTGGTYDLSLTASNGISPDAVQTFTLTVDQAPAITSSDTTTFVTGQDSTFGVTATGFPAAITETGSLPPGVTFTDNHNGTATLSGTPTVIGSYSITITDTNALGTATQSFTLVVVAPLSITGTLPGGTVGVPYTATLTATGGTLPYSWSVTSGSLPPGLSLAADGTVSGTPMTAGSYPFMIQVGDPVTKAVTIVIAAAPVPSSTAPLAATGGGPLAATGGDVQGLALVALLLLILGTLTLGLGLRRPAGGRHTSG